MQLLCLEHDHWNFFCPVTGKEVYKEEGGINAETFRGCWHHEIPNEPLDLAPELKPAWDAYLSEVESEEGHLDVAAFLEGFEKPGWAAFQVTTCGIASETTWTVLDLN